MRRFLIAAVVMGGIFLAFYCKMAKRLMEARERIDSLSMELSHARIPLKRDTIRDSIEVVSQVVVEVLPKKMREALAADEQLIKDLRLKVKQLEALQTTVVTTTNTVPAHHKQGDSIFYHNDQWADIRLSLKDTTFYYNIRDSLATVVCRQYRHRFLWWRWGTKGYEVKMVNFNPHARIVYNRYIKITK